MLRKKLLRNKRLSRLLVTAIGCVPLVAMADWDGGMQETARNIRLVLYTLGGTISGGTLVWSGVQWLISRSNGDHQHSFLDYLKQAGAVAAVGGSVVLGTAAWQFFGSGGA
ncbi:type IV secretion system protein VirB2 [Pseudomonas koreensis]